MFNKKKFKSISEHEVSKHDYVISYINSFLIPVMRNIESITRRIYVKLEAARVFSQEDNPYRDKLMKTIEGCRIALNTYLGQYDLEKMKVIKMIDEYNLEISYPLEGYEVVEFEIRLILKGE